MNKWEYYKKYDIYEIKDLYETIYDEIIFLCGYLFELTDILFNISNNIDNIIKQNLIKKSIYIDIKHPDTNESVYIFINVSSNIKKSIFCCDKNKNEIVIRCIICKPENEHSLNTLQKYISNSAKI